MSETWRKTRLPEIAATLARRPQHEAVRTLITDLLRYGFGVSYADLDHEVRMPEIRGRADTLFATTVFEFKSDLRREQPDIDAKLPQYLAERERQTGRRFLGIATDGATFAAYELRSGALTEISRHETRADRGDALMAWLEPALSDRDDLPPEPATVQRELGRDSLTFGRAKLALIDLWAKLRTHPEVDLKRQLWDRLLREVYGTQVGDDGLFLQHTYLTIVAKTVATGVLDLAMTSAADILSGKALRDDGIHGAVESDFFDWVLQDPEGVDLVTRIARQTARFRLRDVQTDVLKALYESLIDPAQRHDLGEYYTPDWLAAKLTAAVLPEPLGLRVLDPACGSGTFLFHAIRRKLAAARAAAISTADAVKACEREVRGLDVHPVAVIIARVTWLLAMGDAIAERPPELHVPVFLGDAMQWNLSRIGDVREVSVPVPGEQPLRVPAGFAEDQDKFEPGLIRMTEGLRDDATVAEVERALARIAGVTGKDAAALGKTYARLLALYRAGRNGIWPFVLRNLVRPVWLSRDDQRADVLIGNPPWIAYRYLSAEMKTRLRDACKAMNLWVGGSLATQQDLSALFWARAVQLYLRDGGTIGFVLPYAALNRPVFDGLRRGDFRSASTRITEAWTLDPQDIRGVFGNSSTSSCVLIGRRELSGLLPKKVWRLSGVLPRRDASEAEADSILTRQEVEWPPIPTLAGASPYRARFKQGATIVPRRFFLVEPEPVSRLGSNPNAPRMRGKEGGQPKPPWKDVVPPRGPVEREFLKPVLLGESIAPFRILSSALTVVPFANGAVLDAKAASDAGYRYLAAWLRDVEEKWSDHAARNGDGVLRMTLRQRLDHMRTMTLQFPISPLRVVYAKAGTLLAAALVEDATFVVDHMAYWAPARSMSEARYLTAILNSETTRARIAPMQPKGQGGARHFDNLVWELRIPEFDRRNPLHRDLAASAAEAEKIAAAVPLAEGAYFTQHRKAIRAALAASGIADRIDALVARLLDD